jgi:hypothetical protein
VLPGLRPARPMGTGKVDAALDLAEHLPVADVPVAAGSMSQR